MDIDFLDARLKQLSNMNRALSVIIYENRLTNHKLHVDTAFGKE